MRRSMIAVVLAVVALPALVSCGGDEASVTVESAAPETSAVPETSAAPETSAVPETSATSATSASVPTSGPGSEFCARAAEAEVLGDAVNEAGVNPAALETAVVAALAAAEETLLLAPAEVVDQMTRVVEYQRSFADLLEANGWDLIAAAATDDGAAMLSDAAAQADQDELRSYLERVCGIENDAGDEVPVDLPEGEAGIDRFIDLYAIGAEVEVTDEQRQCLTDALLGEVSVEQLELLVGGGSDSDAEAVIGAAFISCGLVGG